MTDPIRRLVNHAGVTLALQELLYGFIMALIFVSAARMGILELDSKEHLILLITGMNLTWGAIDAVVFYIIGVLDQRKQLAILSDDIPREERLRMLMDEMEGTAVDILSDEDARRICDTMLDMHIQDSKGMKGDRSILAKSCVACFIITAVTLIPVVVPLALIEDLNTGLMVASCLSSVMMFFSGYHTGRIIGARPMRFGLLMTAIAWTITIIATFTGG